MEGIYSPATVRALLEEFEIAPLKKLGQNFLCDANVVQRIAEAAVEEGGNVIEIGPGLGVLTDALSRRAKKVVCVEIDAGMVRVLEKTLADRENVTVLHADVLKTDLSAVAKEAFGGEGFSVAGNLPYYITSKCMLLALEAGADRLTAMMQKEVADRLAAEPGSPDFGSLTVSVRYFGQTQRLFPVSRNCFYPKPNVDSAVIRVSSAPPPQVDRQAFEKLVRGLFAMRRKTAVNNLRSAFDLTTAQAEEHLAAVGAGKEARAEALSYEQFVALAQRLG